MAINISSINPPTKGRSNFSFDELLSKEISLFGNQWGDKKKEGLYLELGTLISSGVDIRTALELIKDEQTKAKDRSLIEAILQEITKGALLSEAIRLTGRFSNYEYHCMRIGEESGKSTEMLKELTAFYKNQIQQRRQMINTLTYPSIVMSTAIGAVLFLMNFIIPMFTDVFKRVGADLPRITKVLIEVSYFTKNYFGTTLLITLCCIIVLYTQRNKVWFKKASAKAILAIPFFGYLILQIYLARLCNSMRLLIGAKVPLLKAMELVRQMVDFYPISQSFLIIEKDITSGIPLHISMAKFPVFDKKFLTLIKVGEEVNQLEFFFKQLSEQYHHEIDFKTKTLGTVIEPLLIIVLGIIVGTILIAIYLPLFQMSTNI
jgi:type IV pilus assembly protein PilC